MHIALYWSSALLKYKLFILILVQANMGREKNYNPSFILTILTVLFFFIVVSFSFSRP